MERQTGVSGSSKIYKWIGATGSPKPISATVALMLWLVKVASAGFVMDDFDVGLLAVIAGFYFASRELAKRGK